MQESLRVKFGDGYEQRLVFGLPTNRRLLSLGLTFNVTTAVSKTINDFLNARFDDQDAFDVSTSFRQKVLPDLTSSPLFICTQRTRTRITNERVVLQLTFEETKRP